MADNSDFDLDGMRWGISAALAFAANAYDATSAVKDAGAVDGNAIDAGIENQRAGNVYAMARWLVEDILPQMWPWDGLLPGQSVLSIGPGSPASSTIRGQTRRYWLGGQLVSMAQADVTIPLNSTGSTRLDYLAIEVDADGVGTYVVVTGTTSLPSLASDQYALATFSVNNSSQTAQGIEVVMFEATQRPARRKETLHVSAAGLGVEDTNTVIVDPQLNICALGFSTVIGEMGISLDSLPKGSQIREVRIRVADRTTDTTYGLYMALRTFNKDTDSLATVATVDNVGDALGAGAQTLSLTGLSTTKTDTVIPHLYIYADAANPVASAPGSARFYWVEVDYFTPTALSAA